MLDYGDAQIDLEHVHAIWWKGEFDVIIEQQVQELKDKWDNDQTQSQNTEISLCGKS